MRGNRRFEGSHRRNGGWLWRPVGSGAAGTNTAGCSSWRGRSRPLRDHARQLPVGQDAGLVGLDLFEQTLYDLVRRHAVRFGREARDQAVAKHWLGDRADVLGGDVEAALQQRVGLGAEHEVLARAWASTPLQPLLD